MRYSGREGGEREEDASLVDITEPGEALLPKDLGFSA